MQPYKQAITKYFPSHAKQMDPCLFLPFLFAKIICVIQGGEQNRGEMNVSHSHYTLHNHRHMRAGNVASKTGDKGENGSELGGGGLGMQVT